MAVEKRVKTGSFKVKVSVKRRPVREFFVWLKITYYILRGMDHEKLVDELVGTYKLNISKPYFDA